MQFTKRVHTQQMWFEFLFYHSRQTKEGAYCAAATGALPRESTYVLRWGLTSTSPLRLSGVHLGSSWKRRIALTYCTKINNQSKIKHPNSEDGKKQNKQERKKERKKDSHSYHPS